MANAVPITYGQEHQRVKVRLGYEVMEEAINGRSGFVIRV